MGSGGRGPAACRFSTTARRSCSGCLGVPPTPRASYQKTLAHTFEYICISTAQCMLPLEDAQADGRVLAHQGPLLVGQGPGLVEDGIWYADLAQVVEQEGVLKAGGGGQVPAQGPAGRGPVGGDPGQVAAGVGVLGLDGAGQGLHGRRVGELDRVK